MTADGTADIDVTAAYATTTGCTDELADAYTAPENCALTLPMPCLGNPGDIGGTVFQDINNNGVNNTESGQEGMIVMVFDCDGNIVGNTTTDANGEWTVTGFTDGEQYRVEFTFPTSLAYLQPSFAGTDNGTNTQFVTAPSCEVNYGVVDPVDYCGTSQLIVTSCFINGSSTGTGLVDALIGMNYDGSNVQTLAPKQLIGTTYGIAHSRTRNEVYTGAFLRRHAGFGPAGIDVIYTKSLDNYPSGSVSTLVNLTSFPEIASLGSVTGRDLGNSNVPNRDPDAFDKVGKVGFGDLDISEDENTLYVMDLCNRQLIALDISGAQPNLIGTYPVPDPGCNGNGTYRPFATKVYPGKVYIGIVCDGEGDANSDNLAAFVYTFDPQSETYSSAPIFDFALNYPKGAATVGAGASCDALDGWFPWQATYDAGLMVCDGGRAAYPSPILSDIEFDVDGSMVLAFMDRFAYQIGFANLTPTGGVEGSGINGGDVLRAYNHNGVFELENNAKEGPNSPNPATTGANNGQGPGGGEFYVGEQLIVPGGTLGHAELAMGAAALLPGSGSVVLTMADPVSFSSGGIRGLSNTTGLKTGPGVTLYGAAGPSDPTEFGKSAGLGDVEIACDLLPIQIGNYVWLDTDEDGVQDPCEEPVTNLPVTLIDKNTGNVVAVTTTDGTTGEYYFTETADGLEHDTPYAIVFGYDGNTPGNTVFAGGIFTIAGMTYELTGTDASTEGTTDLNDSDASLMTQGTLTDFPIIMYTTADSTDHSLDVGLSPVVSFDLALTKVEASSGPYSPGDPVTFTIEVFNQGNVEATDVVVSDYVPSDMTFDPALNVANDFAGSVDLMIPTATIASIPAGMSETVTIVLTIDPTTLNSLIVNNAEITRFDDDNDPATDPPVDEDSTPGDNQGDDETDTDNDIDDEFTGTPGTMDNPDDEDDYDPAPVTITQPPCEINITNVDIQCTNETDFTVSFDVEWDNANALIDMIEVTVDGDAQTFTPTLAADMMSFGPITLNGPAYDILLEAAFLQNTECGIATTIDLIACTDPCEAGDLGGNVFNDFNNDGADAGAGEVGQANVLVEVYDCDRMLVCDTWTNADGNWSCDNLTDGEEYRVEFSTPLQPYLQPSFAGDDNGTNTQFVTVPSCEVDYGVV
ncbi:MAG: SdrD B-like domain-containing protein [Lewinella sp.]